MNDCNNKKPQAGFTLLELIIAIGIFALMVAMAYGGLNSALNTREHVDVQAARLAELQQAFTIIGRDIEQIINRPVRNIYADELPPLSGSVYGSTLLALSRNGRRNPLLAPRSNLQRVDYIFAENKLMRQSWLALDQALDSIPNEAILLQNISAVELRFMDLDHQWQPQWPTANAQVDQQSFELPRAVEVSIDFEDWGRVTRLFEVVG